MAGPDPNPNARRRNARVGPRKLPPTRTASAPDWPLVKAPTKPQRELWARIWTAPQAVVWEEQGWASTRVVARYVLLSLLAEKPTAPSSLLAEVRQIEDRLGLSPVAMRRLMWTVDESAQEPRTESDAEADDAVVIDLFG